MKYKTFLIGVNGYEGFMIAEGNKWDRHLFILISQIANPTSGSERTIGS